MLTRGLVYWGKGLVAGLQDAQIEGEEAAYIRREISVYTKIRRLIYGRPSLFLLLDYQIHYE